MLYEVITGKDLYIHFAFPEFLYCAENDPRTKAIFCYIEPGGYYEKLALDWIADGTIKLTKPIVACVTGRWKANLSRAVGHAGAIAGGGDDALAKEKCVITSYSIHYTKLYDNGLDQSAVFNHRGKHFEIRIGHNIRHIF